MALYKAIRQPDGVTTCYHRILYLELTTNLKNSTAVLSYVDETARADEKTDASTEPYCRSVTHITDYSPSMTIELAYEYLKTLPQFEGATDI